MRSPLTALSAIVVICSCAQPHPAPSTALEIRTIENTPIHSLPIEPSLTIDEMTPPIAREEANEKPRGARSAAKTPVAASRQDELSRKMNLPFAPPIAMDPVDGGKVSIRPETPIAEHKNRLYYFGSVKNKQAFLANPDAYLKGKLASY